MLRIINGTAVTPDGMKKADIWIENGTIAYIGGEHGPAEVYDASGCLLFPGFIDAHTHFQMDNGVTVTADDFASGTAAAIAGGTTAVIDFATQERGRTLKNALDAWHSRADGRCACDYGFHMAVTDWNAETRRELSEMADAGVTSFKAYMAYDALRLTDDELSELLSEAASLGCIVGVHCELGDEVNSRVRELLSAGKTGTEYHPLSRPNEVEGMAVRRLMELAEKAEAPAWVVHLSTTEGLREVGVARSRGARVLLETCPQYLTLTDDVYSLPDFEGAGFVCSPPIRKRRDVNALWDAAQRGLIDIISTDHCSYTLAQKALGRECFSDIPNGLPAVENRAALVWARGVNEGLLTVPQFAELMCEHPARAFGLWPRKGAIAVGADADVVVWETHNTWSICAAEQKSKAGYSPWEGARCTGRARAVFLRGELSAENDRILRPDSGCFLPRARVW